MRRLDSEYATFVERSGGKTIKQLNEMFSLGIDIIEV
jgi:hypothetical protein